MVTDDRWFLLAWRAPVERAARPRLAGMTNPAAELIAIFDEWDGASGSTTLLHRSETNDLATYTWSDHFRAASLLVDMERFVRDQDGWWDDQSETFDAAWKYLSQPRFVWSNDGYDPLPRLARASLMSLGRQMDRIKTGALEFFDKERSDRLVENLEQIRDTINDIPMYLFDQREYLISLIDRCVDEILSEAPDLAAARSLTYEVVGAALPVASSIQDEDLRTSLFGKLASACGAWSRDVSVQTTAAITSGIVLAQILPPQ